MEMPMSIFHQIRSWTFFELGNQSISGPMSSCGQEIAMSRLIFHFYVLIVDPVYIVEWTIRCKSHTERFNCQISFL